MRKAVYKNDKNEAVFLHASDEHVELERAKLILKTNNVECLFSMQQNYSMPLDCRVEQLNEIKKHLENNHKFTKTVVYGWLV